MNQELKDKIRILISKGKTSQAIELLLEDKSTNEKILLISSRFNDLKRRSILNLISQEDQSVEKSRIEDAILELIETDGKKMSKNVVSKLNPRPRSNHAQIIIAVCAVLTLLVTFSYSDIWSSHTEQKDNAKSNASDEPINDFHNDSLIERQTEVINANNGASQGIDSIELFRTIPEKIDLAVEAFLDPNNTVNNHFEKLISKKEFDLALQALTIAEKRTLESNVRESIALRRKAILLMKKDSFDNVWYSFPGDFILTERNNKQGLYDNDGEELFKPQFDNIDPVNYRGLFCTELNGKFGLINRIGEELFKPIFDEINPENFPEVYTSKLDEKYGLINEEGRELFKPQFDELYSLNPEWLICTRKGNKYGILDRYGTVIHLPIFSEVELEELNLEIIKVKKNGKYGYLDSSGEYILRPNIDKIDRVWAETIFVKIGSKWGVINLDGNYKLDMEFDKLEYDSDLNIIIAFKNGIKKYFTDEGEPTNNPFSK